MVSLTVTWITYNNYGTELQAFALQQYLKQLGVENYILSDQLIIDEINRKNKYRTTVSIDSGEKKISTQRFIILKKGLRIIKKVLLHPKKTITNKRIELNNIGMMKLFSEFKSDHLDIQHIMTLEDLRDVCSKVDLIICGSDQTWSLLERNFEPFFYASFTEKRKISYAASIGASEINESKADDLRNLLKDFSHISVRESTTSLQLADILNRNVEWVLDPTLLFDNIFWSSIVKNVKKLRKEYLLCYFLEDKEWYFDYAKQMAKYLKLKLVLIPSRSDFVSKRGIVYKEAVGPLEFVKLIENSSYVLTDSYHGSLFSLNFNKQFIYLKRFRDSDTDCQNVRIYSILGFLDLMELIVEEKSFEIKDLKNIDYSKVNIKIDGLRKKSEKFLTRSLFNE